MNVYLPCEVLHFLHTRGYCGVCSELDKGRGATVSQCVCLCGYLLQLTVDMLHNQINGHHVAATWTEHRQIDSCLLANLLTTVGSKSFG